MQNNPMGADRGRTGWHYGHNRRQQSSSSAASAASRESRGDSQSLEWQKLQDEYGREYYYNPATGATAWVWQPAKKRKFGASDSSVSQL